jgi:hypothetical protein
MRRWGTLERDGSSYQITNSEGLKERTSINKDMNTNEGPRHEYFNTLETPRVGMLHRSGIGGLHPSYPATHVSPRYATSTGLLNSITEVYQRHLTETLLKLVLVNRAVSRDA